MNEKSKKPLFASFVWGERYIDIFCDIVLPTHLSKNNLPALKKETELTYVLFTDLDSLPYLKAKPIIKFLRELLDVKFVIFDFEKDEKYGDLSKLQSASLRYAKTFGYDYVFPLYADVLCSDGSLTFSYHKLCEGHGAVLSIGPQTVLEKLQPLIKKPRHRHGLFGLNISPRQLVKYAVKTIHPFHAPSFWEDDEFTNTPSMIFWRAPAGGIVAHGFHLHPVAIRTPDNPLLLKPFYGTLDESFIPAAYSSTEEVYISQDSDEIFMCSTETLEWSHIRGRAADANPNVARVARYAERHTCMLQREFFEFPILIHSEDIDNKAWAPILSDASKVVGRILTRLCAPDSVIEAEDKEAFDGRKYHLKQVENQIKAQTQVGNAFDFFSITGDTIVLAKSLRKELFQKLSDVDPGQKKAFNESRKSISRVSIFEGLDRYETNVLVKYFGMRVLLVIGVHTGQLKRLSKSLKNKAKKQKRSSKFLRGFGIRRRVKMVYGSLRALKRRHPELLRFTTFQIAKLIIKQAFSR